MRILITGSSGRVGSAIAELLSKEHEIIGLDLAPGRYTNHLGSVGDCKLLLRISASVEAIVHAASLHAPHLASASRDDFVTTNVTGTANLLEAAMGHGIRRFVYSSTTCVYGHAMTPVNQAVWVNEELTPVPRDLHDETKLQAEQLCRNAASAGKLSCIGLRFARCFPEPDHLLAIYRLYRGVDVRDVAEAHRLALQAKISEYEVFNISAQSPFRREECEQLLRNAPAVIRSHFPGIEETFARRGWQLPQSIDRVYDIAKARARLGYQPRFNFTEAVW